MILRDGVTIAAPIEQVWSIYADVVRWPAWTESVRSVQLLDGPALAIGERVRIDQPRLPTVIWTVTELTPGRSWTWENRAPGALAVAVHELSEVDGGTRADQTLRQEGAIGALAGRLWMRRSRRYLAMEAAGLRRAAESA